MVRSEYDLTVSDCIFCRIVAGEIPAEIVRSTPDTVAFRDSAPQAPVHVLVVPRDHHDNLLALAEDDPAAGAAFIRDIAVVAQELGLDAHGFRTVINTGSDGGQSVEHLHAHVLGGRALSWQPG